MTNGQNQTPPPPPPSGAPQGPTTPPPAGPAPAGKKKGLPALAWVGIGCGVILIIGLVIVVALGMWGVNKARDFADNPEMMTARGIVAANPELELVEADDEARTLTVRNTKTGEVMEVDVSKVREGKFSFKGEEGEVTMGLEEDDEGNASFTVRDKEGRTRTRIGAGGGEDVPQWVPRYRGMDPEGTFLSASDTEVEGGFGFGVDDDLDEVVGWYEEELQDDGFEITGRNSWDSDGTRGATRSFEDGEGRSAQVMAMQEQGSETRVTVSFSEQLQ